MGTRQVDGTRRLGQPGICGASAVAKTMSAVREIWLRSVSAGNAGSDERSHRREYETHYGVHFINSRMSPPGSFLTPKMDSHGGQWRPALGSGSRAREPPNALANLALRQR